MQKLIIGNWKMNGLSGDLDEIGKIVGVAADNERAHSGLCLPATLLARAAAKFPDYNFGGQDCHMQGSGAHTGCISAGMLVDAGAKMTIIGHSERRADQGESDEDVRQKAVTGHSAGLKIILCIGESLQQREAGIAEQVILDQLNASVPDGAGGDWLNIAYEPIWAIGTGKIPAESEIEAMHAAIRHNLVGRFGNAGAAIHILYGGSMNADNADALLNIPNVDGGLIGGASLTADKFGGILAAASK